ncbi:glycosyltransferase [Zunongwangia pacifica]|uniref:Glycosyl transferase family 28 C-terminal domain-containing protein n=1 Tax=Zunongwangia pacifica TaxID=2911062 RepID=A0A9X1ZL95_9FLAO|nr:glycosyltransferase [Zunongwangia pacifica]MCL6216762.1 hypothetical protein [Zunongwangia pacifica]
MIFVTIGTQEPFDRLIKSMDEIAESVGEEVIAQVSTKTKLNVEHMTVLDFLPPQEFNKLFERADLIIAHAGMGTIISSLVKSKKIIVFPRERKLGEHRSDHQIATAKYFEELGYVDVAKSKEELYEKIKIKQRDEKEIKLKIGDYASENLIDDLKKNIQSN